MKLLDKMYKYEMDPTKTVGATERTQYAGQTDRPTDGLSETNIPPNNFVVRGYNNPALIRILAWCLIGNKPLSEPMLAWFTHTYMHH